MHPTLAILAGGNGSRMGQPKGTLRVDGKPILTHLLDRFQWPGPTLLVTAPGRERPPGWEGFTRELTDTVAGEGPLRGVLTALSATETELLVVATCDMPRIESRHLAWLVDALAQRPTATLVMAFIEAQLEPFPFAIRRSTRSPLTEHLAHGGRSVRSLAELTGAVTVRAPEGWPVEAWINLNTPADLAALTANDADSRRA